MYSEKPYWGQAQSRTQSNACARARMALALGKLTTGTPKFRGSGFVGIHIKPITAQEKFNFPRANAILARAQALLWVRDWDKHRTIMIMIIIINHIINHMAEAACIWAPRFGGPRPYSFRTFCSLRNIDMSSLINDFALQKSRSSKIA